MTFRLVNDGLREVWEASEFTFHTWHPGQAGVDNYLGPHDGRHVSSTSLLALASGRVRPLVENRAIQALRTGRVSDVDTLLDMAIDMDIADEWSENKLIQADRNVYPVAQRTRHRIHLGAWIVRDGDSFVVEWIAGNPPLGIQPHIDPATIRFYDAFEAQHAIDAAIPPRLRRSIRLYAALASMNKFIQMALGSLRRPWRLLTPARLVKARRDMRRGFNERRRANADLASLFVVLCSESSSPPRVVVVPTLGDALLVKLFQIAGRLPPAPIRRIGDTLSASNVIADVVAGRGRLCIPASVYTRFYTSFVRCPAEHKTVA